MDFDPRDFDDPREDARRDRDRSRDNDSEPSHGPCRAGSHERDRDNDYAHGETRSRDRNDDDTRSLGRGGGGSDCQSGDEHTRGARDDARCGEREREAQEHPRDTFERHVDLPRGPERERVRDRDRVYTLRGSESRTLATVGAFRVVSHGLPYFDDEVHFPDLRIEYVEPDGRWGARVERVVLDHELKSEYQVQRLLRASCPARSRPPPCPPLPPPLLPLKVVLTFTRADEARMEGLAVFGICVPVTLQKAVAGLGQGHRVVAVAGNASDLDQPLIAEVPEVA